MAVQKISKNSAVCVGDIKIITIALAGYYLSVEKNLLEKVLETISRQKDKSYSLISYNILKSRTISYNSEDEYISQIILKKDLIPLI